MLVNVPVDQDHWMLVVERAAAVNVKEELVMVFRGAGAVRITLSEVFDIPA
jgi:hypothetical protein